MKTKEEVIGFCLTFPEVYEDYPFRDDQWAVVRLKGSKKVFAWVFERNGCVWVNVKADPEWRDFWREAFEAVLPAYHLNKEHWNSLVLDGSIPDETVRQLIGDSYDLVKRQAEKKRRKPRGTAEEGQKA